MGYRDSSLGQNETTRPIFSELRLLLVGAGRWAQKIESICKTATPGIEVSTAPARAWVSNDSFGSAALSQFDRIWICTQPSTQLQVLERIGSFAGDVILEKPYFQNTSDYLKLFDFVSQSTFGVLLSQPWTFSKSWQTYKQLVKSKGVRNFQITRLGEQDHAFINPVADWLPHDLNLILDLIDDEFLNSQVSSISWNNSMDRVSFDLQINERYFFRINSGLDPFGRTATWTNGDSSLDFLNSTISTTLEGVTQIKEVHPILDFLQSASEERRLSRNLDFHFRIFQQLSL